MFILYDHHRCSKALDYEEYYNDKYIVWTTSTTNIYVIMV